MTEMTASSAMSGSHGHRRSSGTRNPDVARQFRDGLQRVDMPGWIINHRGLFIWLNEAFIELFGDRVGEHYSSVVAPEHRGTADLQFARKLHGTPATDYEIETVTREGERLTIDVSSVRLDRSTYCGAVFGLGVVSRPAPRAAAAARLTPRQLEILGLLARGASTNQIVKQLYLSRATVRNHMRDILQALGANSRLEAVVKARGLDLIDD